MYTHNSLSFSIPFHQCCDALSALQLWYLSCNLILSITKNQLLRNFHTIDNFNPCGHKCNVPQNGTQKTKGCVFVRKVIERNTLEDNLTPLTFISLMEMKLCILVTPRQWSIHMVSPRRKRSMWSRMWWSENVKSQCNLETRLNTWGHICRGFMQGSWNN